MINQIYSVNVRISWTYGRNNLCLIFLEQHYNNVCTDTFKTYKKLDIIVVFVK